MAYNPAQDTIRQKIIADVKARIEAIKPPSFYSHMRIVELFNGNTLQFPNYPAVAIVTGQTRSDDQRLALIEHVLPITLMLMVKSTSWRRDCEKLLADCRVALLSDVTRGGVALTTAMTVEEVFDSEPSTSLGAAQLELEVRYRTLHDDPGSAI